jgi:hypothetical protein
MGTGQVYGLSPLQRELMAEVCQPAYRTLALRLRHLAQLGWEWNSADVDAVRAWLFDIHRDDLEPVGASS